MIRFRLRLRWPRLSNFLSIFSTTMLRRAGDDEPRYLYFFANILSSSIAR
jgi:hypothetical protein